MRSEQRVGVSCIAWLDGFGDDGRQHGGYQLFVRFTDGAHLARAKGKPFASSQDRCGSEESQPVRGGEQADLELDSEDLRSARRERHGRVSAGAVGNAADYPRMDVVVLLCESGREWHGNVDTTRLYKLERRSERLHEGLSRETASNFVCCSQSALPSNPVAHLGRIRQKRSHGRIVPNHSVFTADTRQ
jgi:hypothetical protein